MSLSKSIIFYKALNREINSLKLNLYCDDDKFIVSNNRGDCFEDNIYFSCDTLEELDSFIEGLEAGKLLLKFYDRKHMSWTGEKNKTPKNI